MRAFIIKDGLAYELNWEKGQDPAVVLSIEENGLFQFRAPYVSFVIDDADARFIPGGELKITRGDVVYVLAGETPIGTSGKVRGLRPMAGGDAHPTGDAVDDTVEIFRGAVDRDIEYDEEAGEIRFRAVGFLTELKEIMLGKPNYFSESSIDVAAYRYVKDWTEDTVEGDANQSGRAWEYRVWPYFYDLMSRTEQVGYRKEHIYDSRGGRPLELENANRTIFELMASGVFRRLATEGGLSFLSFEDLIEDIERQLNYQAGGTPGPQEWRIDYNPGEIPGEIDVVLDDKTSQVTDFFKTSYNNQDHVFAVRWNDGEGAEIYEIGNYTEMNLVASIMFENTVANLWARFQSGSTIWNNYVYHAFKRYSVSGNIVRYYEIWSAFEQYTVVDDLKYKMVVVGEWFDVNVESGAIVDHGKHEYVDAYHPTVPSLQYLSHSMVWTPGAGFSGMDGLLPARELEVDWGRYYADGMVVAFAGPRGLHEVQFDLRDTSAADLLLDICKLTNSVMFCSWEEGGGQDAHPTGMKVIKIIDRAAAGAEVHAVSDDVVLPGFRRTKSSYWGERTPQIDSGIEVNQHHLAAIREYYAGEFPLDEETLELNLDATPEVCGIGLMDQIRLPESLGLGRDVRARVTRVEIRRGEVRIESKRVSE